MFGPMSPISSRKTEPPSRTQRAAPRADSARERAANVSEELAFQEALGQSGAIDGHEGTGSRGPLKWSARATISLPVHFAGDEHRTPVGATRAIT